MTRKTTIHYFLPPTVPVDPAQYEAYIRAYKLYLDSLYDIKIMAAQIVHRAQLRNKQLQTTNSVGSQTDTESDTEGSPKAVRASIATLNNARAAQTAARTMLQAEKNVKRTVYQRDENGNVLLEETRTYRDAVVGTVGIQPTRSNFSLAQPNNRQQYRKERESDDESFIAPPKRVAGGRKRALAITNSARPSDSLVTVCHCARPFPDVIGSKFDPTFWTCVKCHGRALYCSELSGRPKPP
jgi:hypothetical protein